MIQSLELKELAIQTLTLARNTLLVKLRFMDRALSMFVFVANPQMERSIGTDGSSLFYNPMRVLTEYKEEQSSIVRSYLHLVMHCVFRHPFISNTIDMPYWNLASDIAVENIINELKIGSTVSKRHKQQLEYVAEMKKEIDYITAEMIYRYLKGKNLSEDEYAFLQELFVADSHDEWYKVTELSSQPLSADYNVGDDVKTKSYLLMQQWDDISRRMKTELDMFSSAIGKESGSLIQELKSVNREKYDYSEFLRKFSSLGEIMKINDDEFDYIFYTYGLGLFPERRMPLIEPLEYKDEKRIMEFVIAIDTSGSVKGDLVQKFLEKTYNIFLQEESFFKKFNIHIIQCDAEVQEDAKITNKEEFDEYINSMSLHGFGGTDFRPVFEYVEKLRLQKEFINLKGLIYFTDGYGTFPENKPDYNTAFVFIDDNYGQPQVPSWAMKLVLQSEDI